MSVTTPAAKAPQTGRLSFELTLPNGSQFFRRTPAEPGFPSNPPYIIKAHHGQDGGPLPAIDRIHSVSFQHSLWGFVSTEVSVHWHQAFDFLHLLDYRTAEHFRLTAIVLNSGKRLAANMTRSTIDEVMPAGPCAPAMVSGVYAIKCPLSRRTFLEIIGAEEWNLSNRTPADAERFLAYGQLPMEAFRTL